LNQLANVEIDVQVRGFDDVYSTVIQRTSYTYDEIIFDAKSIPLYHKSEDGKTTLLELDKLSKYNKL
jgi:inward rectifier potassium channel